MHNLNIIYGKYDYARNIQKRKETVTDDLMLKPGYYWQEIRKEDSFFPHFVFADDWSTFLVGNSWYILTNLNNYDMSGIKNAYLKLRKSIMKMKHYEFKY